MIKEHDMHTVNRDLMSQLAASESALNACRTKAMSRVSELERERYVLEARVKELEEDKAEHDASFNLRWKADMRAIKQWQAAGEGRELTWPDHADLCVWLLDQLATIRPAFEQLLEYARAEEALDLKSWRTDVSFTHLLGVQRREALALAEKVEVAR